MGRCAVERAPVDELHGVHPLAREWEEGVDGEGLRKGGQVGKRRRPDATHGEPVQGVVFGDSSLIQEIKIASEVLTLLTLVTVLFCFSSRVWAWV